MSVGDDLKDSATRHTVYTLRYSKTMYKKQSKLIDQAVADIASKLAIRAPADNTFTKARLEKMLVNMKAISAELYKRIQDGINTDFREFADYEGRFQIASIKDAYPIELSLATVSGAQIYAAASSRPFMGRVLKQWFKDQEYGVRRALESAVRIGFVQGESIPAIARRIGGVGEMTRRQLETLIRTATAHISQTAMSEVSKANADIIEGEEWTATLDGRTTAICRALDGKVFPVGEGPQIPQHWGERSRRVPRPASWASLYGKAGENGKLSDRPFVADKRRVKDIPKSERNQIIGSTDKKTYNEWLRTQKKSFVEDVLGKEKAKLYLDGKLPLDKFVDRTGREYTLVELEKRERQAFKKAGIDIGQ